MKNILLALTLAATGISNAGAVTTIFSIPTGTTNVGTFQTDWAGLASPADLAPPDSQTFTRPYAYRFFTPSLTGSYALGMTSASYDSVMMLYSGITSFDENDAQAGLVGFNDDGAWSYSGTFDYATLGGGVISVNPNAGGGSGNPALMPLLTGQSLTAGTNYLVAITTYDPIENGALSTIPLPADFFVDGPGPVTFDGAVAVPEPGAWMASLLLVIGAWFTNGRRRRKMA